MKLTPKLTRSSQYAVLGLRGVKRISVSDKRCVLGKCGQDSCNACIGNLKKKQERFRRSIARLLIILKLKNKTVTVQINNAADLL